MTTVDELRAQLADLQLETRGNKDALRLRLARAQSRARSPELPLPAPTTRPDGETYDHFLVVDVEATCEKIEGPYTRLAFSYPNEVIELPVNLLTWSRTEGEDGGEPIWSLVVVDEFHSFVRPTWNPTLSSFCKELTGILQSDIDDAPIFTEVLLDLQRFIAKHNLFTSLSPTAWCSDGPWDLRDFIAKACFISQIRRPDWLAGNMVDLRLLAANYFSSHKKSTRLARRSPSPVIISSEAPAVSSVISAAVAAAAPPTKAPTQLSIPFVLLALSLDPFEGRLHSGLADTRNASRILIELARRRYPLLSNRSIPEGGKEKRWSWMGSKGRVNWHGYLERETLKEERKTTTNVSQVSSRRW